MSSDPTQPSGRLVKAPENFLDPAGVRTVFQEAKAGRRDFIRRAFAGAAAAGAAPLVLAQANPVPVDGGDPNILNLPAHSTGLGQGVAANNGYGVPSQFERNVQRRQSPGLTQTTQSSVSFAPLQSLFGTVTPSGLHFERHHQGWWDIDPSQHRLMLNGSDPSLMQTPKVFTVDELMRLPAVSRFHFIECGANTAVEWGNVAVPTVQYTHGMVSCSEFTGVPLKILFDLCGVDYRKARYVLGEGADGSSMTRTIPMELVESGEVFVAYGQNGEMLRPENGYPLRLVVPGIQGVSWVKYLRRIEVGDKPYGAKDEAIHYMDLMPSGLHRQYTNVQECKSVVTTPSGGQVLLDKGFYNITGLAWSGKGRIRKVDVSVDGGRNWRPARIEGPVQNKALTRFNLDWVWDGKPALLQSRATDDTGYVQPTYRQLRAVRGTRSIYHNNAVQTWLVQESGAWDIDVRPDFKGLPKGAGSVAQGQDVWESKCAQCHGVFGESNEVFSPLVGGTTARDIQTGRVAKLTDASYPGRTTLMKVSTVSTLWDYIHRAMPWAQPKSLKPDEVYAVTAYLLNLGGVVPDNYVMSDRNIAEVQARLPNRNGMSLDHGMWPGKSMKTAGKPDVKATACMANCEAEPKVASFLPDFARNAHGNLAEQNRLVGAQRGADTTRPAGAVVATVTTAAVAAPAAAKAPDATAAIHALLAKYSCTACHGMDTKLVGPAFREIARKYGAQADGVAYLAGKIKAGGSGVWGQIPMPPQTLPDTEARMIGRWLTDGAQK